MVQECKFDSSELSQDCCALGELLEPQLFRALSDPNRLTLLSRLAMSPEPRTVGELNSCCPIDLSVVSRHLAVLRDAGVVTAEKQGRKVYYSVCCLPLAELLRRVAEALEGCAANQCATNDDGSADSKGFTVKTREVTT